MSTPSSDDLLHASCRLLEEDDIALMDKDEIEELTELLIDWKVADDGQSISRRFQFKNYLQTVSFLNAVAWIAYHENHHPEIWNCYNKCAITYTTHSAGGISLKDFICAAKVDNLL